MAAPETGASGEHDLIARYFRPLATDPGAFDLIDDAATLNVGGDDLVVTTDAIVAGVHFLPDDPAGTVARKALRVNLSDLAAKGAEPAGFVLTLALKAIDDGWLRAFADALGEDIAAYNVPLLGGDTVSTPGPLMVSVTAFGRVPPGKTVRRAGAAAGDFVAVTGTIGDAVAGLRLLKQSGGPAKISGEDHAFLVDRYRLPKPRLAAAGAVRSYATAAMDVSDGLAGDLGKLCSASGVSADIEIAEIGLSRAVRAALDAGIVDIKSLLTGGDDYEILCTVPPHNWDAFRSEVVATGIAVSRIGVVTAGSGEPRFLAAGGEVAELNSRSFSHF